MFMAEHQRFAELDPHGLSRPELVEAIEHLHRFESHAVERRLTFTAAIDALGDNGADAATITRNHARRSPKAAQNEARAATALKTMPAFSKALRQGQISAEHPDAMANAADRVSPAEAETLVNDAMTHFHVTVPTVSAKLAIAALNERVDQLWREDGGRDGSPNDIRSPAQRRADAFVWLLANQSAPGSGRTHPKFMAIVHLDLTTERASTATAHPFHRPCWPRSPARTISRSN